MVGYGGQSHLFCLALFFKALQKPEQAMYGDNHSMSIHTVGNNAFAT